MLYMVEIHYAAEHRDAARQYLWEHGTTHHAGQVTLRGAWVATQDLIAYALIEATSEDDVAQSCAPLQQFGEVQYRLVTGIDEI